MFYDIILWVYFSSSCFSPFLSMVQTTSLRCVSEVPLGGPRMPDRPPRGGLRELER